MSEKLEHEHDPGAIARRLRRGHRVEYFSDWIYGGIDGAITTFAIVAGSVGAGLSARVILILGFSNIIADGLSMAAANYTGTKAENDNAARLRAVEERHVKLAPAGEREEVRQIFAAKGFAGELLDQIVSVITSDKRLWVETMLAEEHGIGKARRMPMRAALGTLVGFLLCGLVPLLPYALSAPSPAIIALVATTLVFFGIGVWKSKWSQQAWWRSGVETLTIALLAAGAAFLVGNLLSRLL